MTMIEEVAIAIGGLWNDYCNPCTEQKIIKCNECMKAAQAAIETVRRIDKMENENG